MSVPSERLATLRQMTTARWYGLHAAYRRGDAFDTVLGEICAAALAADAYTSASIDVFAGDEGVLTVVGTAQDAATLDAVRAVVTHRPTRRFHSAHDLPRRVRAVAAVDGDGPPADRATPGSWAGATLLTPHGVPLGCLDLWAPGRVDHGDVTHGLLPLLARATMEVFEERRRILAGRAAEPDGPRPVVERRGPRDENRG